MATGKCKACEEMLKHLKQLKKKRKEAKQQLRLVLLRVLCQFWHFREILLLATLLGQTRACLLGLVWQDCLKLALPVKCFLFAPVLG